MVDVDGLSVLLVTCGFCCWVWVSVAVVCLLGLLALIVILVGVFVCYDVYCVGLVWITC